MSIQIQSAIGKATGIKNYTDVLAKVTGNIMSIDKSTYVNEINKIKSMYEKCLLPEIKNLSQKHAADITVLYTDLDLNTLTVTKKRKSGRVSTNWRIRPKDIYDSKWFRQLREYENSATTFCKQFHITSAKVSEETKEIVKTNPGAVKAFKILGRSISEDIEFNTTTNESVNVVKSAFVIMEFMKKLTEIILTPMYDVKSFMKKHWLPQIDQVLNLKVLEETGKNIITSEDIHQYLYSYVVLEYRLAITGSTAEATKIIMDTLSMTDSDKLSPSNLATVVENFKLDEMENNGNIKKFTALAVEELKKIGENEDISPEEIIKNIEKIFAESDKPTDVEVPKPEEPENLPEDVFA